MAKKAFNNFGTPRAAVTASYNLASTHAFPWGGASGYIASTILLGGTAKSSRYGRRLDKNFYHRMQDYVRDTLYPDLGERTASAIAGAASGTRYFRHYKYDTTLTQTKMNLGLAASATIDTNSEAWKTYVGKINTGFIHQRLYINNPVATSGAVWSWSGDVPQKAMYSTTETEPRNYQPAASTVVNGYEDSSYHNRPEYTPFFMSANSNHANYNNTPYTDEHLSSDWLSGCTIGSKKTMRELLSDFRDIFLEECLSYCNHPTVYDDILKLKAYLKTQYDSGVNQPFVLLDNLNLTNLGGITSWLAYTRYQCTIGYACSGATGLIHLDGNTYSGVVGYESIERLMSNGTIAYPYSAYAPTGTGTVTGDATFSKQGRVGALRALQLVIPDNLGRKKYELGLSTDVPAQVYSGLLSTRPLGKFATLAASDGWACEVRVKDTQLSLLAFGLGRHVVGSSVLGVLTYNSTVGNNATQTVISGLNVHSSRVRCAYTKLNSVDFTIDSSNCRIFGFGEAFNWTTQSYTTQTLCGNLTAVGGIDPTEGTTHLPTGSTFTALATTTPIRLVCVIPYNVDDMKVAGDGTVPYFSLASGCESVFGKWSCKAAFGYLKGSYQVFTRFVTFAQLQAIHGATKTIEECIDLATTAFINECRTYVDILDTDPNPVEQLMAYTPLKYVGYDLPPIKSYVKRYFDYNQYPQDDNLKAVLDKDFYKSYRGIGKAFHGKVGSRLDRIAKWYYGSLGNSNQISGAGLTGLEYNIRWLVSENVDVGMDPMLGYYYKGERAEVKAKWGGGSLFRVVPTDTTEAKFKKGGRIGFRAASMNMGILNFQGLFKYGQNNLTLPTSAIGNASALYRAHAGTSVDLRRGTCIQSEVSPELANIAMSLPEFSGRPFAEVCLTLNLYASAHSSAAYFFPVPPKNTFLDYVTNATRVISGVAMRNEVPTAGLHVRLQDRETGDLLGFQLSQEGGKYRFYGCQPHREYLVSTIDPLREYTADIEDVKRSDQ